MAHLNIEIKARARNFAHQQQLAAGIATGQWHHAAITFTRTNTSAGILALYVDGLLAGAGIDMDRLKKDLSTHAREIDAAKAPGAEQAGYLRADWDYGQPIEPVNGEKDLFGDSSIVLVPLPGHTPGTLLQLLDLVIRPDGKISMPLMPPPISTPCSTPIAIISILARIPVKPKCSPSNVP